jgi:hypothetical protein
VILGIIALALIIPLSALVIRLSILFEMRFADFRAFRAAQVEVNDRNSEFRRSQLEVNLIQVEANQKQSEINYEIADAFEQHYTALSPLHHTHTPIDIVGPA